MREEFSPSFAGFGCFVSCGSDMWVSHEKSDVMKLNAYKNNLNNDQFLTPSRFVYISFNLLLMKTT